MKSNYYINFLNLLKAIDQTAESTQLDSTCKLILEEIAVNQAADKLLTVSDVMGLKSLGSPATLHRKLDVLLNTGFIKSIFQGTNRRTKFMVLTPMGEAYFERLSTAITQAIPQNR
jgi:hypothetical protein